MKKTPRKSTPPDCDQLLELMRAIARSDRQQISELLKSSPELALARTSVGAAANNATDFFLTEILHYIYAGDTALHIAAAAFNANLVSRLIKLGAEVSARNRFGAEPLHYACDTNHDDPEHQAETVKSLIAAGADVNSPDKRGATALHRAVRTRSPAAVRTLLDSGAEVNCQNSNGSTPLHLAVQNTGRGGTGAPALIERQKEIIALLLQQGASTKAKDAKGKTALDQARSPWIQELLKAP